MTETLAHLSNNAMYSATIVYALAMLAHVAEWAMARDLPSVARPTSSGDRRARCRDAGLGDGTRRVPSARRDAGGDRPRPSDEPSSAATGSAGSASR